MLISQFLIIILFRGLQCYSHEVSKPMQLGNCLARPKLCSSTSASCSRISKSKCSGLKEIRRAGSVSKLAFLRPASSRSIISDQSSLGSLGELRTLTCSEKLSDRNLSGCRWCPRCSKSHHKWNDSGCCKRDQAGNGSQLEVCLRKWGNLERNANCRIKALTWMSLSHRSTQRGNHSIIYFSLATVTQMTWLYWIRKSARNMMAFAIFRIPQMETQLHTSKQCRFFIIGSTTDSIQGGTMTWSMWVTSVSSMKMNWAHFNFRTMKK